MVRNYFYLIVGFICLLSAFTHAIGGLSSVFPNLTTSIIEPNTKIIFTYIWHIIAGENIVFGIVLLILALNKNVVNDKLTVWLIMAVLIVRWVIIIITYFILSNNISDITILIPESIVMWGLIILLWFGLKKKSKIISNKNVL
ncbi:hypothetical protein [Capnocytophaga canimorsus]|uniref:hypothetical protein n=1 Tax=Capnocytophaga canimorsus TaxID=28188 RepID=UPI001EDFF231|nr:hypothetical protein [Capnocytophaga canimorsus]GJQ04839.1 hypothetical protein CAPN009_12540 [Capnocytophaga canimorsus]